MICSACGFKTDMKGLDGLYYHDFKMKGKCPLLEENNIVKQGQDRSVKYRKNLLKKMEIHNEKEI